MTGPDLAILRRALSAAAGRPLSHADLGLALGLSADHADHAVRHWEATQPSGPAAVAMTYLAQGCLNDVLRQVLPEYVEATRLPTDHAETELVLRLWWPRFIAVVTDASYDPPDEAEWAWIEPGVERLVLALWIDNPALFGADPAELLRRGAALFQEASLDSLG